MTDTSRREKELAVVGGNAGALTVVSNLRQGYADDEGYERELDRLIEEGSVGTLAWTRRERIYSRIAEEMKDE